MSFLFICISFSLLFEHKECDLLKIMSHFLGDPDYLDTDLKGRTTSGTKV